MMNITLRDKIGLHLQLISLVRFLPKGFRLRSLVKPIDATRYTEFGVLLKFLKKTNRISNKNYKVLDISSPFILSYYFHNKGFETVKTDINHEENKYIRDKKNLSFKTENATSLSFADNTFDLVYSISVVEHIYKDYMKAIGEMIRVARKEGIIYVTFPVSKEHKEEWLGYKAYPSQTEEKGRFFFQYRFDRNDVTDIKKFISKSADIVSSDIYWEGKTGNYDKLVSNLRRPFGMKHIKFVKNVILNYYYGFFIFNGNPRSFSYSKDFGNIHMVIEKR